VRTTSILGLAGLIIVGGILADVLLHPKGTATAFNGLGSLWVPSLQGVMGQTPTYRYTKG
jgi:hypothetical protein